MAPALVVCVQGPVSETYVLRQVLKGGTLTSWPARELEPLVRLRKQLGRGTRTRDDRGTLLGPEGADFVCAFIARRGATPLRVSASSSALDLHPLRTASSRGAFDCTARRGTRRIVTQGPPVA